ncbi:uncharacterized protein K444DRAFT_693002 [Hyaloscypha bicolor E]|uniref:Uncharacterized protein n=1 Tax=Hyaloscypha bicolor E TaxID=1095630 RepID=A0A2J6T2R7_9HELO|nr:uncharacterized protein K444DRAFT_693002 [Hyaloscypha bicolor E]PMD57312.1 hypothetical protein K444DRAFT_693002 [Hyaloscypha bicolor E]
MASDHRVSSGDVYSRSNHSKGDQKFRKAQTQGIKAKKEMGHKYNEAQLHRLTSTHTLIARRGASSRWWLLYFMDWSEKNICDDFSIDASTTPLGFVPDAKLGDWSSLPWKLQGTESSNCRWVLRQISELAALWLAFVASDGIASHEERYRRLQETEIRNGVKQIQTETQKAIEHIQAKTRKATRQIQAETQKGAQPIGVENQENI